MSIESFIRAMPKVDLQIQLEGTLQKETLLMMAEQNNVASSYKTAKQYQAWLKQIDEPDYKRLHEIAYTLASWVRYPDDITRVVYDLGVYLYHQNVRYAEVSLDPTIFTDGGMPFETLLEALSDGRDKVQRAWKVRLNWIMTMPRDRPRRADEVSRWASNVAARRSNVVALGMTGPENEHPASVFKKSYGTAFKKGLPTVAQAHSMPGIEESVEEITDALTPARLIDTTSAMILDGALAEANLPVAITPSRELRLGHLALLKGYPLAEALSMGVDVLIGSGMPALYKSTLNDEYLAAVDEMGLNVDMLEAVALDAVKHSFLPDDEKATLKAELNDAYGRLRREHLAEDEVTE
jgi:aminodeoxyfutalosine deaminase